MDEDGFVYTFGYDSNNYIETPTKITNAYSVDTLLKNKKSSFQVWNDKHTNKKIDIVTVDSDNNVTINQYYPNGDLLKTQTSTLVAVDNDRAYYIVGDKKEWIYYEGANLLTAQTLKDQAFGTIDSEKSQKVQPHASLIKDTTILQDEQYIIGKLTDIADDGSYEKLLKDGKNLFVLGESYLDIYDISNAYLPISKVQLTFNNSFLGYNFAKENNYLYIVGNYYGNLTSEESSDSSSDYYDCVVKIDISDIDDPKVVSAYNFKKGYDIHFGITVANDIVYVIDDGDDTLHIIDMTSSPIEKATKKIDNLYLDNSTNDIHIFKQGAHIYIPFSQNSDIQLVDINVADINNITENDINLMDDSAYYYTNSNLIKDDNGTIWWSGANKLLKLNATTVANKYTDIYGITKAVKNSLALTTNGETLYLYKLNDDNTSKLLAAYGSNYTADSAISDSGKVGDVTFIDNDRFFYTHGQDNYSVNILSLGSIKAYDEDFDGVFDYKDAYPKDALRFFIDSDGDGFIDMLNPNTTINDEIYDGIFLDPDFFNIKVNLTNVIIGNNDNNNKTTDGILSVKLVDSADNETDISSEDYDISTINDTSLSNSYNSAVNIEKNAYLSYIYPQKDSSLYLQISIDKLIGKAYIDDYILINTSNTTQISDTANIEEKAQDISTDTTYKGSIATDTATSSDTWLRITNSSSDDYYGNKESDLARYKFVLKDTSLTLKDPNDTNASLTMTLYEAENVKFNDLPSSYIYNGNCSGEECYYYENSNNDIGYNVTYDSTKDEYYYYDSNNDKIYLSLSKLLKSGYYKDKNGNQYYVDSKSIEHSLYFDSSKGEYYYYDNDGKEVYLTPSLKELGSKYITFDDIFSMDMVLDSSNNYFVKLTPDSKIDALDYDIAIIKNSTYYDGKITLDDNGGKRVDIVLPRSKTYKVVLSSDKKLDANLTEFQSDKRVYKVISKDAYFVKYDYGLKAGFYSLYFKGEPNQEIKYIISSSDTMKEQENNDNKYNATNYFGATNGFISSSDTVDYYGFSLGDNWYGDTSSYDINVNLTIQNTTSTDEKFKIILKDTQYDKPLKYVYIDTSKCTVDTPCKLTTTFSGYQKGVYFVGIQRYNHDANYTLDITGSIHPLPISTTEELYTQKYFDFLSTSSIEFDTMAQTQPSLQNADAGSAIILAGIGDEPSDPLFAPTQTLTATMYKLFKYRGFSDNDIYLIDADDKDNYQGVDLSSVVDESKATVKNFLSAITDKASKEDKKGPLYIYMVDHGTNGAFKISSSQILYANDLKNALDTFQNSTGRSVILIIEACKSGSFIDTLKADDRIIITSAKKGELSFIDTNGISFSKYLASELLSGKDLSEAYSSTLAKLYKTNTIYQSQHPQYYPEDDSSIDLSSLKIGGSFAAAGMELTTIDDYYGKDGNDIDLLSTNKLDLSMSVSSASAITKAWAVVIPPNYTPPSAGDGNFTTPDLDKYTVEMVYNKDTKSYSATFDLSGYKYNGYFSITYYVEDGDGNIVSKNVQLYATGGDTTSPSSTNAQDITLSSGWNMIGITKNISNLQDYFGSSYINIVWHWDNDNKQWQAWSPKSDMQAKIESKGVLPMVALSSGDGVWVNVSSSTTLKKGSDEPTQDIQSGWNMIGFTYPTTPATISTSYNASIVWRWDNSTKKWQVYTNVPSYSDALSSFINSGTFSYIDSFDAGSACWIYKK